MVCSPRYGLSCIKAVAQRLLGQPKEALAALEQLNQIQPESGRAAQERGLMALAVQQPHEALPQFILATLQSRAFAKLETPSIRTPILGIAMVLHYAKKK